jgi:hypothetical protein
MMALIPVLQNELFLLIVFAVIIMISFLIKHEKEEGKVFLLGFLLMIFFEAIFISTNVETFTQHSLFGLMPLWLPFLWGYCFVVIKRNIKILGL